MDIQSIRDNISNVIEDLFNSNVIEDVFSMNSNNLTAARRTNEIKQAITRGQLRNQTAKMSSISN